LLWDGALRTGAIWLQAEEVIAERDRLQVQVKGAASEAPRCGSGATTTVTRTIGRMLHSSWTRTCKAGESCTRSTSPSALLSEHRRALLATQHVGLANGWVLPNGAGKATRNGSLNAANRGCSPARIRGG
jgi:hypothetical protein